MPYHIVPSTEFAPRQGGRRVAADGHSRLRGSTIAQQAVCVPAAVLVSTLRLELPRRRCRCDGGTQLLMARPAARECKISSVNVLSWRVARCASPEHHRRGGTLSYVDRHRRPSSPALGWVRRRQICQSMFRTK